MFIYFRSKLSILKSMATDVIDALDDDDDYLGVMTFGESPRVISHLAPVSSQTRVRSLWFIDSSYVLF